MTYNQIIKRIRTISLAHKQVKGFHQGALGNFLGEHKTKYPFIALQSNGGSISTTGHTSAINFRLFFCDLVHVSQDTAENEQDAFSDMISVAMDIIAQLNHGSYTDWRISASNSLTLFSEGEGDMYAGCYVDISISTIFSQNICQIPTVLPNYLPVQNRGRVQIFEDLVTGELLFKLTELEPVNIDTMEIMDTLVMQSINSPTKARINMYKDPVTGELLLIPAPL